MAIIKFTDAQIFLDTHNVSGKHNQISLEHSAEMLDVTAFGHTTKANLPGLKSWSINGGGFWEVGSVAPAYGDQTFFNKVAAGVECPITIAHANTDITTAFFAKAVQAKLAFFGQVGIAAPFTLEHQPCSLPSNYLTRGVLGLQAIQKVASGTGTGFQFSAPLSATQRLAAVVHCVQFTGTSLDVVIESDDNAPFGTPTTRLAFAQLTGLGSEWKDLLGPVATDDRYRVKWTFVGTSFTALVAFGFANAVTA